MKNNIEFNTTPYVSRPYSDRHLEYEMWVMFLDRYDKHLLRVRGTYPGSFRTAYVYVNRTSVLRRIRTCKPEVWEE